MNGLINWVTGVIAFCRSYFTPVITMVFGPTLSTLHQGPFIAGRFWRWKIQRHGLKQDETREKMLRLDTVFDPERWPSQCFGDKNGSRCWNVRGKNRGCWFSNHCKGFISRAGRIGVQDVQPVGNFTISKMRGRGNQKLMLNFANLGFIVPYTLN